MSARVPTGYSVRRPGRAKGPVADIAADVISRHPNSHSALKAVLRQPRTEQGYTADFIFCEKTQRRISKYEADTLGARKRRRR